MYHHEAMSNVVSMLDRPVYGYSEADRLLGLGPGTTKRWVNGYERAGRRYDPVIREDPVDSPWVSWGEFIETRLLAEFRTSVPMIKLRPAVQWLRQHFRRKNPLAYAYPFLRADGKELLLQVQRDTRLDEELWLAIPSSQGVLLSSTSQRFTQAVNYTDDEGPAESVTPDAGAPNVLLHPARREGQPTVAGIRAHMLAGLVEAGEPIDFVAATYDLPVGAVEDAVRYEAPRRLAA